MRDRYEHRAPRSPWAWCLPIALAVLGGQLAADWIGRTLWPADRHTVDAIATTAKTRPAVGAADMRDPAPSSLPPPPPVTSEIPEPVLPEPAVAPSMPGAATDTAGVPFAAGQDAADAEPPEFGTAPAAKVQSAERTLPGPVTARQAGAAESCINHTVATRSPNGWEQTLVNDAPVGCTAMSP